MKKMEFNTCETCGAHGGTAGMLWQITGKPAECANCHKTRQTGNVVIHANLTRTPEELQKTMDILIPLSQFSVEQLLEDYQRRIIAIQKLMDEKPFEYDCDVERWTRITTKQICYKNFIFELERIKDGK